MRRTNLAPTVAQLAAGQRAVAARASAPRAAGNTALSGDADITWGQATDVDDGDGQSHTTWEKTGSVRATEQRVVQVEDAVKNLSAGVSTQGRWNTVSTSSPPSTAAGWPEGAWWTRIVSEEDFTPVALWTVADGEWETRPLPAGQTIAPVLNTGLIDVATIAAAIIRSDEFWTALTGARVGFNADGFQAFDAAGEQTVRLDGKDNLLVGDAKLADLVLKNWLHENDTTGTSYIAKAKGQPWAGMSENDATQLPHLRFVTNPTVDPTNKTTYLATEQRAQLDSYTVLSNGLTGRLIPRLAELAVKGDWAEVESFNIASNVHYLAGVKGYPTWVPDADITKMKRDTAEYAALMARLTSVTVDDTRWADPETSLMAGPSHALVLSPATTWLKASGAWWDYTAGARPSSWPMTRLSLGTPTPTSPGETRLSMYENATFTSDGDEKRSLYMSQDMIRLWDKSGQTGDSYMSLRGGYADLGTNTADGKKASIWMSDGRLNFAGILGSGSMMRIIRYDFPADHAAGDNFTCTYQLGQASDGAKWMGLVIPYDWGDTGDILPKIIAADQEKISVRIHVQNGQVKKNLSGFFLLCLQVQAW